MISADVFKNQETDEVLSYLVKIDHTSLGSPVYLCSNNEDIVYTNTYIASNLNVTLLQDSSGVMSGCVLNIENVSEQIRTIFKDLYTSPTVDVALYNNTANDLEEGFYSFEAKKVTWNSTNASIYLAFDFGFDNNYPAKRYNRSFGGLES